MEDSIKKIKSNYSLLSSEQKQSIGINASDITTKVLYEFEAAKNAGRTFVKISYLFFVVPDIHKAIENIMKAIVTNQDPLLFIPSLYKKHENDLIIADYR